MRKLKSPRTLVIVPTYNERENLEQVVGAVLTVEPALHVLVIDDGSPDGTGELAEELAQSDSRVHAMHRPEKLGLGTAYIAGFQWALSNGYELAVEMDADLSHRPADLPQLLAAARRADVVVGSRNVPGGRVEGWSPLRRLISRGGSWYARTLLRLPIRDCTAGFKCFQATILQKLDFAGVRSNGYGFQIEMNYLCARSGARFTEVPIVFPDRTRGRSKMTPGIVLEAAVMVTRLSLRSWLARLPAPRQELPRPAGYPALTDGSATARRLPTFGLFSLVGASGVALNNAVLYVLHGPLGWATLPAAIVATESAILSNFSLNDRWTFRTHRSNLGWGERLARYNLFALGGLAVSLLVLSLLTTLLHWHYLAANLVGIAASTVWNFSTNSRLTWSHPARRLRLSEGRLIFAGAFVSYVSLAWYLVFQRGVILGDALSRVANAYYVLFSRDPHLAAVGFVWNPLPSVAVLPVLPLATWWPALVQAGFAGNLATALFAALAVYQVNRTLAEAGLASPGRLLVTALFSLHPMVLYYAANGMSEAYFLCFTCMATRYLMAWARSGEIAPAAYAGFALALAYLARYEAAIVAVGALLAVACWGYLRSRGRTRARLQSAMEDTVVVGLPFLFTFALWAIVSWLIVGHPFEQFSSGYGNSSQAAVQASTYGNISLGAAWTVRQTVALEPALGVILVLGVALALRRRQAAPLIPVAVFAPVLLFMYVASAGGLIFQWLRFSILAVPLASLVLGLTIAGVPGLRIPKDQRPLVRIAAGGQVVGFLVLTLLLLGVAIPSSVTAMRDPRLDPEDSSYVHSIETGGRVPNQYGEDATIARYLDRHDLQPGSVLIDTFIGFPIVINSSHPRQFVITSDRDFQADLADPQSAGVHYVMVPDPAGKGQLDAVNRAYPRLYETGAPLLGTPVRSFGEWKLYRVPPAAAPS